MPPELLIGEPADLAQHLLEGFEAGARAAIAARGRCAVALPGGSAATMLFPSLARAAVDWRHVDFFWGDERAVPPDDPESNYGLARRLWLDPAGVGTDRVHRMPADAADLEVACSDYEAEMRRVLGTPPSLDMVLLGVGPDGHICSLFAGHPLLDESERLVAAIADAPKPPPRRMTLTLPALAAAGLIVVAATGAAKAEPIREALRDPQSRLPLALATRRAQSSLFLLDAAAASLL